jgi:DNA-binding CsgD family transcriptional regulator/pimeloyl-ACP methyl ester carboxylesterase
MDAPPVQYVKTSDDYNIAFGVSGSGPPLVLLPGAYAHVQLSWQYQILQSWLEGLATRFRVIQIDERGAGMSQRDLPDEFDYRDYVHDVEAVISRLDLGPFVLLGLVNHFPTALEFAAKHPQQVKAVVLSCLTSPTQRSSFWSNLPFEDWELFLYGLVPRDFTPGEGKRMVEQLKEAFSADDFIRRRRSFLRYELDEALISQHKTPTLILHPKDYVLSDPAISFRMAQILRGQVSLIDGASVFGDAGQGTGAIEAFLAELPLTNVSGESDQGLSERELEVLRLLAAGRSNQQIADDLVISLNTVRRHVSNIFDKTGVANRTEAAGYARDHGLT